jgi:hypothetical protein
LVTSASQRRTHANVPQRQVAHAVGCPRPVAGPWFCP